MIWLSSGIVSVASDKSTSTSYLRSASGLLLVSAFNAVLDNHSMVFARRSRKICSTASASSAMRARLWSSVRRFRQHASRYILTCPLCSPSQHFFDEFGCRSAQPGTPNLLASDETGPSTQHYNLLGGYISPRPSAGMIGRPAIYESLGAAGFF